MWKRRTLTEHPKRSRLAIELARFPVDQRRPRRESVDNNNLWTSTVRFLFINDTHTHRERREVGGGRCLARECSVEEERVEAGKRGKIKRRGGQESRKSDEGRCTKRKKNRKKAAKSPRAKTNDRPFGFGGREGSGRGGRGGTPRRKERERERETQPHTHTTTWR